MKTSLMLLTFFVRFLFLRISALSASDTINLEILFDSQYMRSQPI